MLISDFILQLNFAVTRIILCEFGVAGEENNRWRILRNLCTNTNLCVPSTIEANDIVINNSLQFSAFLLRDATHMRGLCNRAVSASLSVCYVRVFCRNE